MLICKAFIVCTKPLCIVQLLFFLLLEIKKRQLVAHVWLQKKCRCALNPKE